MPAYINPDSEGEDKGERECESNAEFADIKAVAERMSECRRKCKLGRVIAEEIAKYS